MFEQLILTTAGMALLAEILNGHQIQFTKIKLGDVETEPADIGALTDVASIKQTLLVQRSSVVDGAKINIGTNLLGINITESFDWTEIGIFAKDITAAGEEILFSYQFATTPVPIPVGGTVTELLLDFVIQVSNSANVSISIDESLIFVTQENLNTLHNTINGETAASIAAVVSPLETIVSFHTGNTSNPHSVTKSQVGLGSVENQGIATQSEARAGTVSNKYMTPQRVKDAIEYLSILSDGNVTFKVGGSQPAPVSGKTIIWIDTTS